MPLLLYFLHIQCFSFFIVIYLIYAVKGWEIIHLVSATLITVTDPRGRCRYRLRHSDTIEGE